MIYEWILLKLIPKFDCEQVKCFKISIKEIDIRLIWNQNSQSNGYCRNRNANIYVIPS